MATSGVWKTLQACWVEGRLEGVIERKKQLAALHANLQLQQQKIANDPNPGASWNSSPAAIELDFVLAAVAEIHNGLDVTTTLRTEQQLAVGHKMVNLLRPLGIALIIGSETAPLSSCILPLAAALAAGCPAMVLAPAADTKTEAQISGCFQDGLDREAIALVVNDNKSTASEWASLHFDVVSVPASASKSEFLKELQRANPLVRILQPPDGVSTAVVDRSTTGIASAAAQLSRIAHGAIAGNTRVPRIILIDEFIKQDFMAALSPFMGDHLRETRLQEIFPALGNERDAANTSRKGHVLTLKLDSSPSKRSHQAAENEVIVISTTSTEDTISLANKVSCGRKPQATYIFAGEREAGYLANFIPSQHTFVNSIPPTAAVATAPRTHQGSWEVPYDASDFSEVQSVGVLASGISKRSLETYKQATGGYTSYFEQGLVVGLLAALTMTSGVVFGLTRYL